MFGSPIRLEPVRTGTGKYNFSWLQRFLDLAKEEDIAVVVGTPTAAPPKWLVDSMPDMIALDEDGLPREFGSRRHYCFSHEGYRTACRASSRVWLRRWALIRPSTPGRSITNLGVMVPRFPILRRLGPVSDIGYGNATPRSRL